MSVNGDAVRRDMWAGRIERCLASGAAIGEWYSLNKVIKSSLYRWLAVFCDEEHGRFAGKNSETSGWAKVARDGIAVTKAVVPAVSAAGQTAADPAEETPGSKGWRSGKPLGAFSTKRENSERLPALCGCFDARRCFRSDRARCSLGVCVARCECRCQAHACDERERKGDWEHCGRGLFHGVTSLMAGGGFATHGAVSPCDICWRHFTIEDLGITTR